MGHLPDTEPGRSLGIWVQYQGIHNFLDLLSCDPEEFKLDHSQSVYDINQDGPVHLRTNLIKQITGLKYYMRHIFQEYNSGPVLPDDPFDPFTPESWTGQTAVQMRSYLCQHLPTSETPIPSHVPSGNPLPSTRKSDLSPAALQQKGFGKGIKREIVAYPTSKDKRYLIASVEA